MKKIFALLIALVMLSSMAFAEAGLTSFISYDISGGDPSDMKMVSQDIFAPYDLTMVNIWATWCGYCVKEMPELAKLKTMLPENVNLISLCTDADEETELAMQILQMTGANNFTTIMETEEMYDGQLLADVHSFPTTYFLDSEGMPVCPPVIGVPSRNDAAGAYFAIINDILASMEA